VKKAGRTAARLEKKGLVSGGRWITTRTGQRILIADDAAKAFMGGPRRASRKATRSAMRPATAADRKRVGIGKFFTHAKVALDPTVDLQGTGVSPTTGKTRPFYSKAFQQRQQDAKFYRVGKLAERIKERTAAVAADARRGSGPALAIRLIMQTGMRNGYDNDSGTYGASSLLTRHVMLNGNTIRARFPGKKGVPQDQTFHDPLLAGYIRQRKASKATRLFDHRAEDTLSYWKKVSGEKDVRVHDLRTLIGSVTAAKLLEREPKPKTPKEYKALRKKIAQTVARRLGNTGGTTLSKYIHPRVWRKFE